MIHGMTLDQIRENAPSVFGENPHSKVSDKYRFVSTAEVLEGLMDNGFVPVAAKQTGARNAERLTSNRHMLRFRHGDLSLRCNDMKDGIPEIVLFNSHNGQCSYRLFFGIFRMACENGLIVASSTFGEVKVRHIGSPVDNVITASYDMIHEAPKMVEQVTDWQSTILDTKQQKKLALLSMDARPTDVKYEVADLLEARRVEDDVLSDNSRSLWKTMNVIQENIIKGGFIYKDANNVSRTVREVKAVHADEIINRNLWQITENFANKLAA